MATFLTNSLFQDTILPFILIFTLVFAILDKSKLLGEGKTQINALIGFVLAAILMGFSNQVAQIKELMIFLIMGLVILFVLMLIYGFMYGDTSGNPLAKEKWVQVTLGAVILIAVIIAVLVVTGKWDTLSSETISNVAFIIAIVAAVIAVVATKNKKD